VSDSYDTVFALPSVDDHPDTELGVLLMGFAPDRLLAGLGVAVTEPAAGPAAVTLLVDQLRHGVRPDRTFAGAVAAGAARWRAARAGFAVAGLTGGPRSAALRRLWEDAAATLAASTDVAGLRTDGAAERVYLTACWLRRDEVTALAGPA